MARGNYYGTVAESIMFFATNDYDLDVDIENHVNIGDKAVFKYTYKGNSFELQTNHFNINILVREIINTLTEANLDEFEYKIDSLNALRSDTINVLHEKFHGKVSIGNTYYRPSEKRYRQVVKICGIDDEYNHYGPLEMAHIRPVGTYFIEKYLHYTF